MFCGTVAALWGFAFAIFDVIAGCAILPASLILSLSNVFNLCRVHKSLTVYSMSVDLFINIDKYVGWGTMLLPVQTIVIIAGLVLLTLLLSKVKLFTNIFKRR